MPNGRTAGVLVLGIDPTSVAGLDGAEAIRSALEAELVSFSDEGIAVSMTLVRLDESAESAAAAAIGEQPWDVVVIGGGIRKPEPLLEFFEAVVNMVRQHAPQAAIAFNTGGDDSLDAAKRWLPKPPQT